jgi:hypothetical protein
VASGNIAGLDAHLTYDEGHITVFSALRVIHVWLFAHF